MSLTHSLRVAANRASTNAFIAGLLEDAADEIERLENEIDGLEDYIESIDTWSIPKT